MVFREEQVAPSFEVGIADAAEQREILLPHDVTVGNWLHRHERRGRNRLDGREKDGGSEESSDTSPRTAAVFV